MQATLLTNLMLPLALGVIMLGLGLGLTVEDFRRVARYPRAVLVGLALQTLLLPWAAFGLALTFRLPPELAAHGMALSRTRRRLAEARVDPMQAALAYALNLPGVAR